MLLGIYSISKWPCIHKIDKSSLQVLFLNKTNIATCPVPGCSGRWSLDHVSTVSDNGSTSTVVINNKPVQGSTGSSSTRRVTVSININQNEPQRNQMNGGNTSIPQPSTSGTTAVESSPLQIYPVRFDVTDITGCQDQWLFGEIEDCRILKWNPNEQNYFPFFDGSLVIVGYNRNEPLSSRRLCFQDTTQRGHLLFELIVEDVSDLIVRYGKHDVGYFLFEGAIESLQVNIRRGGKGDFKLEFLSGSEQDHWQILNTARQARK